VDIHPQRVELIEKSVKAHDLHIVSVICADSTKLDLPIHSYDKVLLDAPCSGLGTLKNKAEIKRHLKPEDLDQLVILQSQLLDSAAKMVAEGGQLIYSTCTLDKKENERQIASFINRHPEFKLDDQLTMMPMDLSSDGFYVARLFQNSTDMLK
jgi:16S rRNA (cytosine967-C5)-methyltransferase